MKNRLFLWGLLFTFTFASCGHKDTAPLLPDLVRAEALMYAHPDSALQLLERMPVPSSSDRLQNATWCLLMTQARDKNYIKHTSDSLVTIAYDYFMKQGAPQRKALAANYKGVVNGELNHTEQAMQCYLEAAKEVEKTDDYRLAHLIFSNIGHIYLYRSLSEYAMQALQKAYYYAKLSEDKRYIINSLSSIARVYSIQSNREKAIEYYKEAIVAAQKAHEVSVYSSALSELSGIYVCSKNYALALEYAKQALNIKVSQHFKVEQSMLLIGEIYRSISKKDSAAYFLKKAAISDNIRTACAAYQALYLLSKEKKQYEKAIDYNDKFIINSDSIHKSDRNRAVIEMQEKYNQEKLLNEKKQLKIEKDHTIRTGLVLFVFLICLIAVLVFGYQRKLLRKERTIQKNEEQIRLYTLRIHENESLMSRNRSRMEELIVQIEKNQGVQEQWEEQQNALSEIQQQNEALRQENEKLQTNISSNYSTSLQEKTKELNTLKVLSDENFRLHDREKFLCSQLVKQSDVLSSLKKFPKYLDADALLSMQEAVNNLYDNFTMRLSKQMRFLTERELQFCCLIKLRLSNPEIATLLGISPSSVSKQKQRIKERITQNDGKALGENQTLDLWLWEY